MMTSLAAVVSSQLHNSHRQMPCCPGPVFSAAQGVEILAFHTALYFALAN